MDASRVGGTGDDASAGGDGKARGEGLVLNRGLFDEAGVIHSPGADPLPDLTLEEVMARQARGECYPKQIPEEKRRLPESLSAG